MNDMQASTSLRNILIRAGVCDEGLLARLMEVITFHKLSKDQSIIQVGQQVTHFFVIISGLARYYYLSPTGKEWNKAFFREGQLVGSLSAMLTKKPCNYTISCLEKCHLAALPVDIFDSELGENPQLQRLLNKSVQSIMLLNEEREALLLTCNSEARYLWLLENQKWLVSRVAQYHLASYLGIEPASLSRLKKHLT